jgi:hypothetical protein
LLTYHNSTAWYGCWYLLQGAGEYTINANLYRAYGAIYSGRVGGEMRHKKTLINCGEHKVRPDEDDESVWVVVRQEDNTSTKGYFRLTVSGDDNNLSWYWVMIFSILGAGFIVGTFVLAWAVNRLRKYMKDKKFQKIGRKE